MGQMANMSRAGRFIETFNELLTKADKALIGKTFRLTAVGLGQDDCSAHVLCYYTFKEVGGEHELTLTDNDCLFDPQYTASDDEEAQSITDRVHGNDATNEQHEAIFELFKKANL